VKHAIDVFVGQGRSGANYYDLVCGARLRTAPEQEVVENEPIEGGGGRGWCPVCFPDKVAAQLQDEDGNGIALHPDLGELQRDGDGTVVAEDRGDEEVIAEEVVEE
jgi:hypothetical protein